MLFRLKEGTKSAISCKLTVNNKCILSGDITTESVAEAIKHYISESYAFNSIGDFNEEELSIDIIDVDIRQSSNMMLVTADAYTVVHVKYIFILEAPADTLKEVSDYFGGLPDKTSVYLQSNAVLSNFDELQSLVGSNSRLRCCIYQITHAGTFNRLFGAAPDSIDGVGSFLRNRVVHLMASNTNITNLSKVHCEIDVEYVSVRLVNVNPILERYLMPDETSMTITVHCIKGKVRVYTCSFRLEVFP